MATERFANDVETTLAGSINSAVTSIVVASATGFPSSAQYRIRVNNELMLITGGAGTTTWTVTRGIEGTSAAAHTDGIEVVHVVTAGALGTTSDPGAATPGLRSLGTGAAQAAAGNDARLSDARTPTTHATTHQPGGSDAMAVDAAANTGSLRTIGTGATQAAAGNHPHAESDVTGLTSDLAAKEAAANKKASGAGALSTSDTFFSTDKRVKDYVDAQTAAGAPDASDATKGITRLSVAPASPTTPIAAGDNDPRMTNVRTPSTHATSHQPGGSDAMAVDAAAGTGSLRTLGTGATQAAAGNDARFAGSGGGSPSMFERTLAASPPAGGTTITIDAATPLAVNTGLMAIDPFTIQCEIRRFTAGTTTLTLSSALTFAHSSGDRVLFFFDNFALPVTLWGWVHGADTSPVAQAALDAILPDGMGRALHFPAEQYLFNSMVTVRSDTQIIGDGAGGGGSYGTQFRNLINATVFDLRAPNGTKDATRITFEGIQFVKHTDFATSAYVIDADASDFCQFNDLTFGNNLTGCMNGINFGSSGVTWLERCRFLDIGAAGQNVQTSGDDAAIKATATSDVLNVTNCSFERSSKILLTDVHASYFRGCHMEVSSLVLHNSSHNTFADFTPTSTDIFLDNKSNDNVFDNVSGALSRLIDLGSNTYRKVTGFTNVGRLTRSFGPFDGENSPITPDVIATDYATDPPIAYGQPGDVILFAVKVMSPVNASSTNGHILIKDTSGATQHTSATSIPAGITVGFLGTPGPAARTTSRNMESYTYWAMVTVPAGQKLYIDSPFVASVWASKVINPDPFLDATTFWGGGVQSGSFSAAATCTPSMSATQYRVDWTANSAWSVTQYMKWPDVYSSRYLQVLRGRWNDTTQHVGLGSTNLETGLDLASTHSRWSTGDGAANLQTTDKMLFNVIQPGITVPDASRVSNAKFMRTSFGGFGADFTANTQVEIDWCAVVPLDSPGVLTKPTYAATNVTTDRTYDAGATTTQELADVLGTLIGDLRVRGVVR